MERRMFLKATGAAVVLPSGSVALGPALVRQGDRRLKDITPGELMELLAWAEIPEEDVATVEDAQQERGEPIVSLHPQYYFEYDEGKHNIGLEDRIWFRYWCSHIDEDPEWDEVECSKEVDGCISIGDMRTHDGYPIAAPIELVRWFLEHGFRVC